MGVEDILMGRTKLEVLENYEEAMLKGLKEFEKTENQRKKDRIDFKLRKKLIKFFKELNKLGINVWLDKEMTKPIKELKDIESLSLREIYKEYVLKTLKEINKEVNRRIKKNEY